MDQCPRCAEFAAPGTSLCPECGFPLAALSDAGAKRVEFCEIRWWRGYLKSDFYATRTGQGASGEILARSPLFRCRRHDLPPESEQVKSAHAAVVVELERHGWQRCGGGPPWYRLRFTRPLD